MLSCWDPARRGQSTPANWEIHADADSLVKEARQSAIAATIILEHTDPARFEALARQIHALRLGCGRRLKIIVREAAGRIDYAHEMQLYHVGASRILRADMSLSDCFRAISALKGQWFWRAIEPDFDSFYASFNTSERFGYLAPVDFTATADEFMRCGLNTNLDSVLVRLTLRSDQHHLAVINAFHADRPGVFLTTDDKHIYLFLFACPASDIDATMSRQFAQPVGDLFSFYEVIVVPKEIEEELDRLRYNAEYVGYTDYSELLQAQASGGMH
ncbi:MAG: BcsE family c-di-GMP-binding protein [Perlucidibaca sp.]